MLAENATIDWHPEHIRDGRFGEWLANNVDWALSRDRFWGTPLPIWRCAENHLTCVGSRAELSALTGRDLSDLDPHRPAIDEVVVPCRTCGARGATRRAGHRRVVRLRGDARGAGGLSPRARAAPTRCSSRRS